MRLGDLAGIGVESERMGDSEVTADTEVTGFALDHRQVAPGNVFGAFRGVRFNGEDFAGEAVARGAVAVVARPEASPSLRPAITRLTPTRSSP
jgi:UDP-N-acetylmuramoyl-L-alanyl-D-glutamate--2,6-diaminopimelate ligase